MNKKIFSLLCLTILAIAIPSCRKRKEKPVKQDEINTMIELDNVITPTEDVDAKNVKF